MSATLRGRIRAGWVGSVPTMTAADGPVIFTNIAFSEKRPTWRGWSRDTGDLTISSGRIVIEGLKRQLMIEAPFVAGFRDEKYSYRPMIELTGSMGTDLETSTYLVVRGMPRSKFAAAHDEMIQESQQLIDAITRAARNEGG